MKPHLFQQKRLACPQRRSKANSTVSSQTVLSTTHMHQKQVDLRKKRTPNGKLLINLVAEYAADKCGSANMLPYSKILYIMSFITYMKSFLKQTLIQSLIAFIMINLTVNFSLLSLFTACLSILCIWIIIIYFCATAKASCVTMFRYRANV